MTDLNAIGAQLETNLASEGVPLLANLLDNLTDEISSALPVVDIYQLVVTEPELLRSPEKISLSGNTTLLGRPGSRLSMLAVACRKNIDIEFTLALPEDFAISVPGFDGWGISGLRFEMSVRGINDLYPAISVTLLGTIKLGGMAIPVRMAVPIAGTPWRLQGAFDPLPLPDMSQLAALLGADDALAVIPAPLNDLGALELQELELTLGPVAGEVSNASLRLGAADSLQLGGPQISLDGVNLLLRVDYPLRPDQRVARGLIGGTLALGDIDLWVSIALPPGRGGLRLSTPAGRGYSLPNISVLTGKFFPAGLLPPVLDQLSDLALSHFSCAIDTDAAALAAIGFSLRSQADLQILPGSFTLRNPALTLHALYPADAERRSVFGTFRGEFMVGDRAILVSGEIAQQVSFSAALEQLALPDLMLPLLGAERGDVAANFAGVALQQATLAGSTEGDFTLAAAVSCDFPALAAAIGIQLPDSIGDITLNRLALSRDADDESWRLQIDSDTPIPFDPGNPGGVKITGTSLSLTQPKAGATQFGCTFVIDGSAALSPEIALQFKQLAFSWQQAEKRWSVEGEVSAAIVGTRYPLQAAIEVHGDAYSIALSYPATLPLSELGGAGSVTVRNLTLASEKRVDGGEVSNRWGLSGAAHIKVDHLLEADGALALQTGADGTRLILSARAPQIPAIALPLGFPHDPELHLSLDDLTLGYSQDGDGQSDWSLISAARLRIANIPDLLKNYLPPEELSGHLRADGKRVAIGFDVPSTLQPEFPELALRFANDTTLSLGKPELSVTAIELVTGKRPELRQTLRVSLPPQLNHLFGRDANGQPKLDLFNEHFEMQLVMAKKLGLTIATSPFKALTFDEEPGDDGLWTKWDFGPAGKVRFRVPEFAFQSGRWKASCGFHRLTDLALPLTPLKFLLEQSGFPGTLTTAIPDALPLKDIDLTGDNFSREMKLLLGERVLGQLDKKTSAILNELFDTVKAVIDRLPSRLQDYLQIRIPESAILEISVDSSGGGSTLGLRTLADEPPLKFLFPMMVGIPELVGVSLRGLSVGQKMGGSLALIEIDGHIDRFDMVSLIAALTLDRQDISNRYILEDTLCVLPTGLPVPIPLFYSHLGLDYRDILGFNIQAHWSYPDPQLGVFETIALFTDLMAFFREPDYLLHEEGFGETLGLELTIGENFITLPEYLGGQTLGLQKALPTLSVGDSVARFLDFLKTGNAGYAITAIPLRHEGTWIRIGSGEIHFGPLVIGMSWCVTTDEEFVDFIIPASQEHGNLPVAFDNAVLESLPTEAGDTAYQKGFIILLMGHAELGSIVGMRTEFGIAVTAQGGFETGFRMAGEIGRALLLQISGAIQAKDKGVTVKGSTGLYWNDKPLIAASGRITVSDAALEVEIKIELTPFFYVEGTLVVGKQGLLMSGNAAWGHGADGPDKGLGASIQFASDGMTIGFDWRLLSFDGEVLIRVPGDGDQSLFTAMVVLKPDVALQDSFSSDMKAVAKSAAQSSVDKVYDDLQDAIGAVDSIEISVAGLRDWLPKLCDRIIATITSTINANTNGWKRPGRGAAHTKARPHIKRLETLRDVARDASDKTIRPRLKAALQDIVNHNHLNIGVGIPSVRWKRGRSGIRYPVYYTRRVTVYRRNLMDPKQLGELKKAIDWIHALPGREGAKIELQQIYDELPDRDKLLAEVNRDIDKGVDGAVPRIESVAFETSLELLNIRDLKVRVTYLRGGTPHIARASLDLSDPAKTTQQLIDAFGTG